MYVLRTVLTRRIGTFFFLTRTFSQEASSVSMGRHFFLKWHCYSHKVEKILKDSLDLIQSPSVKIQIMGKKVCLRHTGKTFLGVVNKLFVFKILLTTPQ